MGIQTISPKQLKEAKQLFAEAFDTDSQQYIDFFFSHKYRQEDAFGLFLGSGELAAMLYMLDYHTELRGTDFPVKFIVGVSTAKKHRYSGYAKKLMCHAFQWLYAEGIAVNLLHPFKHEFYEKLGYQTYSYVKKYLVSQFSSPQNNITVKTVEDIYSANIPALTKCYQSCMRGINGYIVRDEQAFRLRLEEMFADKGVLLEVYQADQLIGYSMGFLEPEKFSAMETVFDNQQALYALADGVCQTLHRSYSFFIPDYLTIDLPGYLGTFPYGMARVIHPKLLLEHVKLGRGRAVIQLKDNHIAQNNRLFQVVSDGQKTKVHPLDKEWYEGKIAHLTVRQLAALAFGHESTKLEDDGLCKLFSDQKTAVYETY